MHLLNRHITTLTIGSVILSAMILILVFYSQSETAASNAEESKAISDLSVAESIIDLKYPGYWNIKNGELYKGQTNINNNFSIVDEIRNVTGDTCAIFLKNICVSTTVPEGDCNRAIGLYAPYEVISKNLEIGHYCTGHATLVGENHYIAYKPIKTEYNEIIGVLYVGIPTLPYDTVRSASIKTVALVAFFIILIIGMVTKFFVARLIRQQAITVGSQEFAVGLHRRNELPIEINKADEKVITNTLDISKTNQDPTDREINGLDEQERVSSCNVAEENELLDSLLESPQELPKGLNLITLRQILSFLKQKEGTEITIPDVSEMLCLSKVTVRHYLDYLYENNLVDVEQKYGSVGRPQRIYKLKL